MALGQALVNIFKAGVIAGKTPQGAEIALKGSRMAQIQEGELQYGIPLFVPALGDRHARKVLGAGGKELGEHGYEQAFTKASWPRQEHAAQINELLE